MNQLRGANPRIDWMPLPRSRADLSEDVKSLILNLSKDFDVGIIPTQLRVGHTISLGPRIFVVNDTNSDV